MSKRVATLSLQQKVSLTLLTVMGVLALLSYVILTTVVTPAFDQLELDDARTNLVRAERAIQNDLDNLTAILIDWAQWDDAYTYARGEYREFERSNLDRPTLTNLNLNLLLIFDDAGELLWGQMIHEDEIRDHDLLGVFERANPQRATLIHHDAIDDLVVGLLRTRLGPMLFSSSPILTSYEEGPIAGTMIMAQFMDERRLEALRERTEVDLGWHLVDPGAPIEPELSLGLRSAPDAPMMHAATEQSITSLGLMHDLYGEPLLILQVVTPRLVSALGNQTVDGALLFLALAGIVVTIVTWLLLRTIIVMPLEGLASHIIGIRRSGDLTQRLDQTRGDEIGALANEFDRMTDEVHRAREMLLDQSFKAGKADTAAEVLHNIRNAMTPLINGIDRLRRYFKVADSLRVDRATGELADPDCPADRKSKLVEYLESAFQYIKETCDEATDELKVASRQARQVEAILADQEKHANVSPVIEPLELDEVLDEAVLVIPQTQRPEIELNMPRELGQYRVRAHRVGLLQVLGNLILNAYEAIQRNPSGSGRIDLTASAETVDEQDMVRLTVRDTGCGFDDQVRNKIFQRGFSSKEGHMSGLGLHWCANALAGMGGRIDAESTGPGHGAEFHVLLPAAHGG